jgi:hypothetical protein
MALAATSFARALREPLRLFTIEGGALEYVHGGEQLIKGTRSHPAARLSSTTPHRDLVLHESGVLESDAPGGSRSDRDQVDRLESSRTLGSSMTAGNNSTSQTSETGSLGVTRAETELYD